MNKRSLFKRVRHSYSLSDMLLTSFAFLFIGVFISCCFILYFNSRPDFIILIGDKSIDIFLAFSISCLFTIHRENKKAKQAYMSIYIKEIDHLLSASLAETSSFLNITSYAEKITEYLPPLIKLTKHMKLHTFKDIDSIIQRGLNYISTTPNPNPSEYHNIISESKTKLDYFIRIYIQQ